MWEKVNMLVFSKEFLCKVVKCSDCVAKGYMKYSFLAPLAKGQRAIAMVLCSSCVCPSARLSINSSFKKLLLRNY